MASEVYVGGRLLCTELRRVLIVAFEEKGLKDRGMVDHEEISGRLSTKVLVGIRWNIPL